MSLFQERPSFDVVSVPGKLWVRMAHGTSGRECENGTQHRADVGENVRMGNERLSHLGAVAEKEGLSQRQWNSRKNLERQ